METTSDLPVPLPLAELKNFVSVHAAVQGLKRAEVENVLAKIAQASGETADAWPMVWMQEAQRHERQGRFLEAAQRYNLARFPFVESPLRARALRRGVDAFDQWRVRQKPLIARFELDVAGQTVPVYGANFEKSRGPLILVMGGIVALKEQWHQFLLAAPRIGCPVAVMDFPGAGDSSLVYRPQSAADVGAALAALLREAAVKECIAVASSFAGTLFLKLAVENPAIRALILNGSPVHDFFTDPAWWEQVPQVTKLAMAACMKLSLAEMEQCRAELAIAPDDLTRLALPVVYIASLRDEIIPRADWELLAKHVPGAEVVGFDDVHGTPNRLSQASLEIMWRLLGFAGKRKGLLGAVVGALRFFANLRNTRGR